LKCCLSLVRGVKEKKRCRRAKERNLIPALQLDHLKKKRGEGEEGELSKKRGEVAFTFFNCGPKKGRRSTPTGGPIHHSYR